MTSAPTGPTAHKPTEEQEACIAAAKSPSGSIMLDALAGCAKTSTTVLMAQHIRVPALELVFNKRNAVEMSPKMPGNFKVQTMNGLGFGAWMRNQPQVLKWDLDARKLGKIVSGVAKDRKMELTSDQWEYARKLVEGAMLAGLVPGDQGTPLISDTREVWQDIGDALLMTDDDFEFVYEVARDSLVESIKQGQQGKISFDDQVYLPTVLGGKFPQYPFIGVDEAQDLNALNHEMIAKTLRVDGRLLVVGDPKQCHPPGTMIGLSGGGSKPIEQVKIGDRLISYNRKVGFTGLTNQGVQVLNTSAQYFDGRMVRVNTGAGETHDCTPNHRCMARWTEKKGWCLYLMQKGNQFRIGIAQARYKTPTASGTAFGPSMRGRQEKADAVWVLDAFETKDQAAIQEKVIWTLFGLPDLIFHCSGKASTTQVNLDAAWAAIGDNTNRAIKCLEYFGREFAYPIWRRGQASHIGMKSFLTEACNLISVAMSVKTMSLGWSEVYVERYDYQGLVYGLTVGTNGYGLSLYTANGIVTHNSIYAFRGACTESMNMMLNLRPSASWTRLPLATTFRCPKAIVARQQEHAPGFTAWHTNPEGLFTKLPKHDFRVTGSGEDEEAVDLGDHYWCFEDLEALLPPGGDMAVLCRNNGPLLALAFKLLRDGIGVAMLGRDIGKGLIALSRKLCPEDLTPRDECSGLVEDWKESESSLARANGHEEKVSGITDRAECLQAALANAGVTDAGGMRRALHALFARDNGRVTLGSIHRAKGMEFALVGHLDPWRIPSKFAREALARGDASQMQQENNLRYVCETRTKHTLVNINLEEFHS